MSKRKHKKLSERWNKFANAMYSPSVEFVKIDHPPDIERQRLERLFAVLKQKTPIADTTGVNEDEKIENAPNPVLPPALTEIIAQVGYNIQLRSQIAPLSGDSAEVGHE